MPVVRFGVSKALEPYKPDPETNATKSRKLQGNRVVTIQLPPPVELKDGSVDPTGWTMQKYLSSIETMAAAHWEGKPDWVESSDPALRGVLASEYGCAEGQPKSWKAEA